MKAASDTYGYLAEFASTHDLLHAIQKARGEGYQKIEAYTPMPVEEVSHALGYKNRVAPIVFCGGLFGSLAGLGLQYWVSAIAYPLNVGGRPYFSWPAFIPVIFELTILCAALSAVLGMLALNGLPQPHHPLFGMPNFELASRNRFFLVVEAADPRFDRDGTRALLQALHPLRLDEVPQS